MRFNNYRSRPYAYGYDFVMRVSVVIPICDSARCDPTNMTLSLFCLLQVDIQCSSLHVATRLAHASPIGDVGRGEKHW